MMTFTKGDRVTIDPNATAWGDRRDVRDWVYGADAEVYIFGPDPDSDGDLYVLNRPTAEGDGLLSAYVNELYVKPYVEPTPSTPDYTFDPGGSVIDYDSVQVGDTIAARTYSQWRIGVAERIGDYTIGDSMHQTTLAYSDPDTTEIRLLNRPEVEPDAVQVQAISDIIGKLQFGLFRDMWNTTDDATENLAKALVKAGVTAQVFDA